eukprot:CAMPEP_0113844242 /NCGR_PEP_ID=MMETSP0372-20130328/139_1 /TAXON_ID=340204 /ORGANISM="Lankesteria abbotti" /LENGTH=440 /DNA_ID=CAMNT_0000813245 /DNA_START=390 /DNA_END=1712 /DNA_ORIENTATION=- /assembly_acc=CAM_ASM_000359
MGVAAKHTTTIFFAGWKTKKYLGTTFIPLQHALYIKIYLFVPILAALTWASLFSLKFSLMFELLIHLYEAGCLLWFWTLNVNFLGGTETGNVILNAIQPKTRVLSAPPFCCCPCLAKQRGWTQGDLRLSYALVIQYGVFAVVSVLSLAISQGVFKVFSWISSVSLLVCMYGIMIVFKMSRQKLKRYNLGSKLAVLKVVVFGYKGIELILQIPHLVARRSILYSEVVMRGAWRSALTNSFMLPMAFLASWAFNVKELESDDCCIGEYCTDEHCTSKHIGATDCCNDGIGEYCNDVASCAGAYCKDGVSCTGEHCNDGVSGGEHIAGEYCNDGVSGAVEHIAGEYCTGVSGAGEYCTGVSCAPESAVHCKYGAGDFCRVVCCTGDVCCADEPIDGVCCAGGVSSLSEHNSPQKDHIGEDVASDVHDVVCTDDPNHDDENSTL